MSKGLLAWWRRRTASFGVAGAALCGVPVAIAALIGLGAGVSGVTSGFGALATGPQATAPSAQTDPNTLNRTVLALASKGDSSVGSNSDAGTLGAGRDSTRNRAGTGTVQTGGPTGSDGSRSSTVSAPAGSGGSGGGSSSAPGIGLPGTGGAGETVNNTVDTVNNTVGGAGSTANNTVNGVNNTVNGVGNTVNGVNNTVNGVGNTVNGLLDP
jgi:hypothetical protein